MKWKTHLICLIGVFSLSGCAEADVSQLMEAFMWKQRVVVLLAHDEQNPIFRKALEETLSKPEGWQERDLVTLTVVKNTYVAVGDARKAHLPTQPFIEYFEIGDAPFTWILIGKDGLEKARSAEPLVLESLYETIDAMPMRQRELGL